MSKGYKSTRLGIVLCLCALLSFVIQDAFTKILIVNYDAAQLVMIRFWAFAIFATIFAISRTGLRRSLSTKRLALQIFRSLLLVFEIALFAIGLRYLELADIHAIFIVFPLLVTALAPFILREAVGWRRWCSVIVGFVGALIIIRPGSGVFDTAALIPLFGAFIFALYIVLTRLTSRTDQPLTSLIYLGWVGAIAVTPFGLAVWLSPTIEDWYLLAGLSTLGVIGHMLLILALQNAPASTLQPLNYLMVVLAVLIGFAVFNDLPDLLTIVGAFIVVASGLYTMFRERKRAAQTKDPLVSSHEL